VQFGEPPDERVEKVPLGHAEQLAREEPPATGRDVPGGHAVQKVRP
jgi:hypothetical protein